MVWIDPGWTPEKEAMMDEIERRETEKKIAQMKQALKDSSLKPERAHKRAYMRAWRDKNRAHYKELMKRGYAKWKAKKAAEMPPPDSSISKMSSLPSDARAAQRIKEETQ